MLGAVLAGDGPDDISAGPVDCIEHPPVGPIRDVSGGNRSVRSAEHLGMLLGLLHARLSSRCIVLGQPMLQSTAAEA